MTDLTAQCWDAHNERFGHRRSGLFWWDVAEIHRRRNKKISGMPTIDWVQYSLQNYFHHRLPLSNCLSLGCGNGHLERELARLGAFHHCDAYDIAPGSIRDACHLAQQEGYAHIDYYVSDANKAILPEKTYDAVYVNMAMHHFANLEHVCNQIRRALKPDGFLFLNEYIGPNRFQFPDRQKEVANACLAILPDRYRAKVVDKESGERQAISPGRDLQWILGRVVDKARDGQLAATISRKLRLVVDRRSVTEKQSVQFPTVRDVIAVDPSESVRSQEIIPIMEDYFQIVEKKNLGGNIMQFLLADIAGNFTDEDEDSLRIIKLLLDIEDVMIQAGEFESDFAFLVAKPL